MCINWLLVLVVVIMVLLLLNSFLQGSIELFSQPDKCRFVTTKMRYVIDEKGEDIQSLFRSNDGAIRLTSMNREQCQSKCATTPGCIGYTIPRDGECVLYEEGKLLVDPPDSITEPVPFYECGRFLFTTIHIRIKYTLITMCTMGKTIEPFSGCGRYNERWSC